jgi:polysaccharide chain length determinant protein (PEP-CTERM system associated)
MLGHREFTLEDYADILKRRYWLILVSVIGCLGLSLAICHFQPAQYVSQTLVLIEQQKVPEDYVKPVVNEDLNARLASMKEQILSRSRIEPIIAQFNLYPKVANMDDKVDLAQKAVGINPIASGQPGHGMPGFFITFKAQDAHTAQQVCGEITSLFVSENLSAREQSAEGTTDFLRQQLVDAKRNLDQQDAKLADFQRRNIGRLPEQESSNASTLQALTARLDATTQTVSRQQQEESFLQAMVTEQSQASSRADPSNGSAPNSLQSQLKDALQLEKEMEGVYTPNHPDVVAIKRRIANLQSEIAHETTAPVKDETSVNSSDSPQLKQLKTQLRIVRLSLEETKKEQEGIAQQVKAYEAKIESSPMVEEEYKDITRDHETAQQFYNTLLSKMNESTMATALEHRQQGEQFHVMDAPNLPESPISPKRSIWGATGLGIGLILGLLLVVFFEYRDPALRNEADIWAFTKLPTLAVVSYIKTLEKSNMDRLRERLKMFITRSPKPAESVHN